MGYAVACNRDNMFRKLFLTTLLVFATLASATAQKKEIAQAKADIKAGNAAAAEASMRALLADANNKANDRIWLVLFDAVKKQYDDVNEQMYLKQSTDTAKLFDATRRMFGVLEGLDSVDAQPDEKGRIRLNYRRKHAEFLDAYRKNLFSGGQFFLNKHTYDKAFDLFSAYIDCAEQPLFEGLNYAAKDNRLKVAAFYALYSGFRGNNPAATLRYKDLAQQDAPHLSLTLQYVAETYRMQGDTLNYVASLEKGFANAPESEYFFPHLFDYNFQRGDNQRALALCDSLLTVSPDNSVAMIAKTTVLLVEECYDQCIELCDRLIAADENQADAYLNAGLAYFNQGVKIDKSVKHTREQRAAMREFYRNSLKYMQRYRELAPSRKDLWAMPLYTIYLNLNMGKEFEEIDALLKQK